MADDRRTLGHPCLEQLFNPLEATLRSRYVDCDILLTLDRLAILGPDGALLRIGRRSARMEGAHGQLGTRLSDGLGCDDTHRRPELHGTRGRKVAPVAIAADSVACLTGQRGTDAEDLDLGPLDRLESPLVNLSPSLDDDLAGLGVDDVFHGLASEDSVREGAGNRPVIRPEDQDALQGPAIDLPNPDVLRNVDQAAGQVASLGGLHCRVRETLAGTVGRQEVLERHQALTEVGLDRQAFLEPSLGVGHEPTHPGNLPDLLEPTLGRAGRRHHVDRTVRIQLRLDRALDLGHRVGPDLHQLRGLLCLGDQATVEVPVSPVGLLIRLGHDAPLLERDVDVTDGHRDAGDGRVPESEVLEPVHHLGGFTEPCTQIKKPLGVIKQWVVARRHHATGDETLHLGLVKDVVVETQALGQDAIEDDPPDGRRKQFGPPVRHPGRNRRLREILVGHAHSHLRMEIHHAEVAGQHDFLERPEGTSLANHAVALECQVIETNHHVLRRRDDRLATRRREQVVVRHHQLARFTLRLLGKRHVDRHLVTVEVGIERGADKRMDLDRASLNKDRIECLDAEPMQGRCPVQEHGVTLDHFLEHIPDLAPSTLDDPLGALDVRCVTMLDKLAHHERLEQFECHLLGQAALVQLEVGADHDDRTAGVVDALAEQVLAEPPLLATQHVREALELVVGRSGNCATPASVVDQRVTRFLQHALLVTDDDLGRAELKQTLETVVPVDHPTVEVVQVTRRKPAAI